MPIAKMQKVRITGLKRQKRHALDYLQELGLLQVEELSDEAGQIEREINYDALLSELDFAISFLEPYEVKETGFLEGLAAGKESVSYFQVKDRVRETDFKKIIKQCRGLEAELMNLDDLTKNLLREKEMLEPWQGLDFPLKDLSSSERVTYFTGAISPKDLPQLKEIIAGQPASLEIINSTKLNDLVLIAASKESSDTVHRAIVGNEFSEIKLPTSHRSPSEELSKIQVSLIEADMRRDAIKDKGALLAKAKLDLMIVHDFFLQKKVAQNTEKKTSTTTYTYSVEGWTKKRTLGGLEKNLSSLFPESMVIPIEPKEEEMAPIAIENSPLMKPFEAVTGIYGLPGYKEVDPTPLLAVFFIVFFGLCLGDAGYGITLTLVSFFFYKKVGPASGARKLLKLLVYGGVLTFIVGAVTGGWFGVEPANFPEFLTPAKEFLLKIRVIDPVQNPIGMLVVALAIGLFQVIFGIFVSFYIKIRDKDYLDAVLDDLLWVYFILALATYVCQQTGAFHVTDKMSWFVLGGVAALVLTQGRKEKNILLKIGKGIMSLYSTVGYLSDTLSYSRILALGLATSIIAMVINMVAVMTKDMIPVVGYVIMILILIGGHTFNIAINVLGSFIHSSRLQFVEFFSKFLEGGGTEFKPFRRESKFIEIK